MEQSADYYFKIATKKLQQANEELFKNGNTLNKKNVCQNAHAAIENYLKGFLVFHQTKLVENNSIAQLFEQCLLIDIHLQKIDMKEVICRHSDSLFMKCEELETITACFEAADNIDTYFRRINILN